MNVLITGASSGIGKALALECARRGDRIFACGRDAARLEETASECRAAGAAIDVASVDVADAAAVSAWISACDAAAPLDRVFSNAGVATGPETEENVRRTFSVNVGGCVNTVLAALAAFRKRAAEGYRRAPCGKTRLPQIVVTSSVAGYGPLESCPSYSATKSCVKTWALALRGALRREGIQVSVVCPGFVRSRITDANTCPMPFFMEAGRAARIILSRADRNCGLIAFPWPMRFVSWLLGALPWRVNEFVNRFVPDKSPETSRRKPPR